MRNDHRSRGGFMKPLLLDVKGKRVTIFGGGEVGFRKAQFFLPEASVVVVSKDFVPGFQSLSVQTVEGDIDQVMEKWIDWADFVVAATDDPELNEKISKESEAKGRFFNRADKPGTFLIPSVVSRDNFIIAISTLGRSPGMSKFMRLKLEEELGEEYSSMIDLQEELRLAAKEAIGDQRRREQFLWKVLMDERIWSMIAIDYASAKQLALAEMEEFK